MIGIPYNPNNCIFITSQALNADQFNPNVPDAGNITTHNMLWDTVNKSLIWVNTKTNIITLEISGGGGLPFGNDTGIVNAYQTAIAGATLTDGYVFELKIANTNTGASTLQINSLGILPVIDSDGNPIAAGMLESDSLYMLAYNSTFNSYQLLGEAKPTNLPITLNVIPKGTGTSITDGSWSFSANDIIPNISGSNIGDATHRIGTIFMASTFDYANDLVWKSGIVSHMTLTAAAGNLGLGIVPAAKLHILGVDQTLANFALKAQDSIGTNLFVVRNDGNVGINLLNPNANLQILGRTQLATDFAFKVGDQFATPIFDVCNDGTVAIGGRNLFDFHKFQLVVAGASQGMFLIGNGVGTALFTSDTDGFSGRLQLWNQPQTAMGIDLTNLRDSFINNIYGLGIGTGGVLPAKLTVKGNDVGAVNYTLKAVNFINNLLLSVRNDGLISMPLLQVGNAGLVSGDLYVDTAANILLNGDLVVGRKV